LIRVKSSEADPPPTAGFPTVVNPRAPAAVSPPQRVILSLSSGRVNFRKAVIPDLPEIIDCIFVYDEERRVRSIAENNDLSDFSTGSMFDLKVTVKSLVLLSFYAIKLRERMS